VTPTLRSLRSLLGSRVAVHWRDAISTDQWVDRTDETGAPLVETIGFLDRVERDFIRIAGGYIIDEKLQQLDRDTLFGYSVIPLGMVRAIVALVPREEGRLP